jgi:hypothetical protein
VSKSVFTKPRPKTIQGRTKSVTEPDETASESAASGPGTSAGTTSGGTAFADCPVELTVLANGQPILISQDGSSNYKLAKTPPEHSVLTFNLVNKSDKPLAVLLTVDGINVIRLNKDERADPEKGENTNREKWRKFVLKPAAEIPLYTIKGWRNDLTGQTDSEIKVDTEANSLTRFETMAQAVRGKIEMQVFPANNDVGVVPPVTGGDGTTTPPGGGGGAGTTTDTDMPAQADAATEASPMEQMDKSIGKTKSAVAAKSLVLKKLPGFKVEATPSKKGMQVKPPAPTGKPVGKTKGLVLSDGTATIDGGGTTEENFVHAAAPMASISVTYYTPEMAGTPAPGGS